LRDRSSAYRASTLSCKLSTAMLNEVAARWRDGHAV
jgi:hypothetical protein